MIDKISVKNALTKGDKWTKLSSICMGLGMIKHGQLIKIGRAHV